MWETRTMLAWCGSLLALALGLGLSAGAQQGTATRPKSLTGRDDHGGHHR